LSEVFNRNQIGVHMIQADVDSMLLCDLLRNLDPSVAITVEEESALVSLVGNGTTLATFVMPRALAALGSAHIAMTSCGCWRSISFVVPKAEVAVAVEGLHREFFRAPDPEVFAATPESARYLPVIHTATPSRGLATLPVTDNSKEVCD